MKKNSKNILLEIDKIFFDLFNLSAKNLSKANMFTCLNWDSLNHVKLISRIEKKFKIKISSKHYISLTSYKSIRDFLMKSLK
jgi:acyl carrier protein